MSIFSLLKGTRRRSRERHSTLGRSNELFGWWRRRGTPCLRPGEPMNKTAIPLRLGLQDHFSGRFKINSKVPRGPPSPPAPVMHSPTRKVTVKEQQDWKIPPCISNWKNQKGYTIPLDKRLAADGRGLQQVGGAISILMTCPCFTCSFRSGSHQRGLLEACRIAVHRRQKGEGGRGGEGQPGEEACLQEEGGERG